MSMAICHTCKGPVHDNPCNPFRIREEVDHRLRAEKAEAVVETWQVRAEAYRQAAEAAEVAAKKAEAERDRLHARLAPSVEYVDGLACGYGEDELDRLTGVLTRLVNRVTEMETDQDWPTSWPQTDEARRILRRKK